MLEYKLNDHNTKVVVNNTIMTLGEVFFERAKTDASPNINYFEVDVLTKPGELKLKQVHKVAFIKKDAQGGESTQANVGKDMPFDTYAVSPTAEVLWVVRWTQKGLMPIRHPQNTILAPASP